jgi:hypothetical protein
MTKTTLKFIATTTEMNRDTDIIAEDIRTTEDIQTFLDEVLDRNDSNPVYVVGEEMTLAQNIAAVFNAEFEKEMELMKEANVAKELVNEAIQSKKAKEVVDTKAQDEKNAAARAFLDANGPAVQASTKSTKKEEKEMESTKVTGRRRIAGAKKVEVEVQTKTNEKVETEMKKAQVKEEVKVTGRRRISGKKETTVETKNTAGRRQIKRGASMRGNGFKKHEGNWWSNVELYTELEHVQSIVDSYDETTGYFSCPELSIEALAFVEPTEISRYRNRNDIDVVIQLKSNGAILEFPIKEASSNSKSPLTSTSIGWVEYAGKVRPAFGFWRPNAMEVELTCGCGSKFKANTGNVYCPSCKTRHDDITVELDSKLDFAGDVQGWVFQEVPNLVVAKGILAIVMAMAHYEAGYDMEGLIEEDAE